MKIGMDCGRRRHLLGWLTLSVMLLAGEVHATDYYVRTDGDNTHSGLKNDASSAFATIQKGIDTANPGDTIHVAAGEYKEYLRISGEEDSGSPDKPITIIGEFGSPDKADADLDSRKDREVIANFVTIIDPSQPCRSPNGWVKADASDHPAFKSGNVYKYKMDPERSHVWPSFLSIDGKQAAGVLRPNMRYAPEAGIKPVRINDELRKHGGTSGVDRFEGIDWIDGYDLLTMPKDQMINLSYGGRVFFWDGIEALYGFNAKNDKIEGELDDNIIYLRLRDGSDPSEHTVAIASREPAVYVYKAHHIVLKGFLIRGAAESVRVDWVESHHNVIEKNYFTHGSSSIRLLRKTYANEVRDNVMTFDYYGLYDPKTGTPRYTFGAWGGSCESVVPGHRNYPLAIKQHLYLNALGKSLPLQYAGTAIALNDDGADPAVAGQVGNTVCGNHIFNSCRGVMASGRDSGDRPRTLAGRADAVHYGGDHKIHDNVIHDMSSIGIVVGSGEKGCEVYDNEVSDCNINLRIQDPKVGPIYIYRNRFASPLRTNTHIYRLYIDPASLKNELTVSTFLYPEVYIYHNTFVGGRDCMTFNSYARRRNGYDATNVFFINNVVASLNPVCFYGQPTPKPGTSEWVSNVVRNRLPTGYAGSAGNALVRESWFGTNLRTVDFDVVTSRVAKAPALDLSKQPYKARMLPFNSRVKYQPVVGAFSGETDFDQVETMPASN